MYGRAPRPQIKEIEAVITIILTAFWYAVLFYVVIVLVRLDMSV